ncbi:hypothetical protein ACFW1A_12075 [Kitasatospora sp. NPDC058965]|uniref:hypothetical protein n=1 Tax=Kitasatospora sp. NPDC058965 TaxID=3346682 RepID=UPI0036AC9740
MAAGVIEADRTRPAAVRARPAEGAWRRVRRLCWGSTPHRVRTLTGAAVVALLVFLAVITTVLTGARDSVDRIGHRAAPQAVRAADLSFALSDMDAQAANLLLVGSDQDHFAQRSTVREAYEQRRAQADADLEQAAEAADNDAGAHRAVNAVLDGLGQYEALVARSDLQESAAKAAPGRPAPDALTSYQQATDLLRSSLLPAADQVAGANEATVQGAYDSQRADLVSGTWWLLLTGLAALGLLGLLQYTLATRYRRRFSPPLAAAVLLTVIGLGHAASLAGDTRDRLHTAKADAYDSVISIGTARLVAYDSNADESRYLVDPSRATTYEQSFLAKSQRIATMEGATLADYDSALALVVGTYRNEHVVDFKGYLADELRNVTFPGEQAAAEQMLLDYQAYQKDDRTLRSLNTQGQLAQAVAFDTGTGANQSDADFNRLGADFDQVIAINQSAFDRTVRQSDDDLATGTTVTFVLLVAGALALTVLAVRPRLREYR